MSRRRVVQAFSAGGVVFRRFSPSAPPSADAPAVNAMRSPATPTDTSEVSDTIASPPAADPIDPIDSIDPIERARVELVLVGRSRDGTWVLPKGTPKDGETPPETATREVREETGIEARILEEIGSIHYWFTRRGTHYSKDVRHYLMEATGGDIYLHDAEYDDVQWFPFAVAIERLTHENEVQIVRRAEPLLRRYLTASR